MSREALDPNHYVTFEVTIPRDSDAITALSGMAIALGFPTRQRPALPTDLDNRGLPELWKIRDKEFLDTSSELWQSEDYGASAVERFKQERCRADLVLWNNGKINSTIPDALKDTEIDGVPIIPLHKDGVSNNKPTGYKLSNEAMFKRARILWDHSYYPFTMDTSDYTDEFLETGLMRPKAGEMTRERLAHYVRGRRYDEHTLHGTLGKMFDTINVVAGVTGKGAIGNRDIESEFIEADTLGQMMREAELSTRAQNNIGFRVSHAIREQLETGRPYEHGEIVVEGKFSRYGQYDRIATSSLAAVLHSYNSKRETQASRFLKRFAQ